MATPNLSASTREYWDRTVYDEVYLKCVLINRLIERNQVVFKSGLAYKATVDYAEMDDLAQEYGDNEPLKGDSKSQWATIRWYRKRLQLPIKVTGGESLDNADDGAGDGQIFDLQERLVAKGQRAMRKVLNNLIWRAGSSARDAEGHKEWQGVGDALTHDVTYGGLARLIATPAYSWWQGGSLAGTYTDQATAMVPSIDNFRRCVDAVSTYIDRTDDLLSVTSKSIWRTLQSQVEGQRTYKEGPMAKYGFMSFSIDGVEVVAEPWLDLCATRIKYFTILHIPDWQLRLSRKRRLGTFTGFEWQGKIEGGKDDYLGHLLLAGNLVCTQPNASILKTNVA